MTDLGPGGEFDRLRSVFSRLAFRVTGVGDDAALVTVDDVGLAISCDLAVENQHFRLGWLMPREIGWRAGAAALSDLAAVAAEPLGILTAVGVPEGREGTFLEELMEGVADAGTSVGAVVWGGDLVRAAQVTVDVTVVGRAPRPVRRSGAQAGDGLWVTGRLGAPRAAVEAWELGHAPSGGLRERFAHPTPRVREAAWLRDQGATAMIDVSDGVIGDAGHVAAASGVRVRIDAEHVPVHEAVGGEASGEAGKARSGDVSLLLALGGGEEYELLVTLPDGFGAAEAHMFADQFGLPLTRIGEIEDGAGVTVMRNGSPFPVTGGYSHF